MQTPTRGRNAANHHIHSHIHTSGQFIDFVHLCQALSASWSKWLKISHVDISSDAGA
jgi:hypothetical protein